MQVCEDNGCLWSKRDKWYLSYQRPQVVSLSWWNWGENRDELKPQSFHCSGGRNIKCYADKDNPKEEHLARMNIGVSLVIPFRTVSGEQSVYKAVQKFFENYLKALKECKHRLQYKDIVDYDSLLGQ